MEGDSRPETLQCLLCFGHWVHRPPCPAVAHYLPAVMCVTVWVDKCDDINQLKQKRNTEAYAHTNTRTAWTHGHMDTWTEGPGWRILVLRAQPTPCISSMGGQTLTRQHHAPLLWETQAGPPPWVRWCDVSVWVWVSLRESRQRQIDRSIDR